MGKPKGGAAPTGPGAGATGPPWPPPVAGVEKLDRRERAKETSPRWSEASSGRWTEKDAEAEEERMADAEEETGATRSRSGSPLSARGIRTLVQELQKDHKKEMAEAREAMQRLFLEQLEKTDII